MMTTLATAAMGGFPGCGGCGDLLNGNNHSNDDDNVVKEDDEQYCATATTPTTQSCAIHSNNNSKSLTSNNNPNRNRGDDGSSSSCCADEGGGTCSGSSAAATAGASSSSSSLKKNKSLANHLQRGMKKVTATTIHATATSTSTSTKGQQRCYRLNLERPFDIHCEQSPLEYGDYMAPWSKEVYPITVGPTEYCPPRHLGGNSRVWQELLRRPSQRNPQQPQQHQQQQHQHYWSKTSTSSGGSSHHHHRCHHSGAQDRVAATTTAFAVATSAAARGEEEEKVNSLDMLDGNAMNTTVDEEEKEGMLASSRGGVDNNIHNNINEETTITTSLQRRNDKKDDDHDVGEEDGEGEDIVSSSAGMVFTMSSSSSASNITTTATGYRCLTSHEQIFVQKRLGERNDGGEYTFEAYDLTHVIPPDDGKNGGIRNIFSILDGGVGGGEQLHTVFSMESSSTSEEERLCPITPEEIAKDTARLFRRSELSMRERLEGEGERVRQRCRRRQHNSQEQQQQQRQDGGEVEGGGSPNDSNTAAGGDDDAAAVGGDGEANVEEEGTKTTKKKSRSSTLSNSGKKIFRSFSRALSELQGTPAAPTSGGMNNSRSTSSSVGVSGSVVGIGGLGITGMDKRSSMQALTIDKARDLVDNSHDEEMGNADDGARGNISKTKPLNVSLYIMGEYDVLNDLVNDGAKRLRENKEASDLHLLQQNDPCPPPDRWVRSTGWGRCNPGSMYARYPPEDFDWVRYYDKLRLKTGPSASSSRAVSRDGQHQASRVGAGMNDNDLNPHRQDGTTDTQTTAVIVSSSDLSGDNNIDHQDEHHHVGGRLIKVTRASSSMPLAPKTPERELHRSLAASVAQSLGSSSAVIRSNTAPARTALSGNGDGRSRFNQPKAATTISKSATTPGKSASSSYAKASSSASTPGSVNGSTNLSGSKMNTNGTAKSSFGRKLSSMLGRKKSSSGAE